MQSALGYIPLHPPPLEVGTPCTPEMAALTRQHAPHPPSAASGGWYAVHARHVSTPPALEGTWYWVICHPAGGKPCEPDKATLTGLYAIQQVCKPDKATLTGLQQVASRVSQARLP